MLLLTVSTASAQPAATPAPVEDADRTEEAKALFAAGRSAFDAGRYADALSYFDRAYAISKRAALLYNIGIAHDRLRDDEKALEAYDAYLAALPEAPNRVEVETRAAAIRAALATRQAQQTPVAPTPAQTAAAAQPSASSNVAAIETDTSTPRESPSILERWWFWTAVGVVVVGGVTIGVVAASGGDAEPPSPLPPKGGVVVTTLGVSP